MRPGDRIVRVRGREVLAASGNPTVEAYIETASGHAAAAASPGGTSRGRYEAKDLVDGGTRYRGLGALRAAANVNGEIAARLIGMDVTDQRAIDEALVSLDGTADKSRLGGNAVLAASMAAAKAGASALRLPLYAHLAGARRPSLPYPVATVIAGGRHSPASLDFEDYMLVMAGFESFGAALEALVETRRSLEELCVERFGPVPDVGGALAPPLSSTDAAFDLMLEAGLRAGCGGRFGLGLDVVGGDLFDPESKGYAVGGKSLSADETAEYFAELADRYPLVFLEDPLDENDFAGTAYLTRRLQGVQVVGDDLFASNPRRLQEGIRLGAANMVLLKVNQIGTVSEAMDTATLAKSRGFGVTVSIRSSDTTDPFIADLAVAVGAEAIKLGSPVRGERVAKYNRLTEIESELETGA